MPFKLSPPPDSGFLGDHGFAALLDSCMRQAFGEVGVPSWFKARVETRRDPSLLSHTLGFSAVVEAHERLVDLGRGFRRHMRVRRRRVVSSFSVEDLRLKQFWDEVLAIFSDVFGNFLMSCSVRLYEADPRIGWNVERNEGSLPRSKILDPRGLFSRSGLPEDRAREGVRTPHCPFCRLPHDEVDPPVWAGANLMWVHPSCWGSRP